MIFKKTGTDKLFLSLVDLISMTTPQSMSIFVDDFSFKLNNNCICHKKFIPKISISYLIKGDFLKACQGDEILYTVDYDLMCKTIKKQINFSINCRQDKHINNIFNIIKNFSPLIKEGHIKIYTYCQQDKYEQLSF